MSLEQRIVSESKEAVEGRKEERKEGRKGGREGGKKENHTMMGYVKET